MCIIAIKQSNQSKFDESIIRTMFSNNPDGAGYMVPHREKVLIKKGFMDVDSLIASLKHVDESLPMVLHFRIGTHGANNKGNTHPFPISFDIADLTKKKLYTDLGMVHNGIISSITPRAKISDTMEYILTVVSPLMELSPYAYKTEHGKQILDTTSGSKLAFMNSEGDIETVGDFQEDEHGRLFSNASYKVRLYTPKSYTGFYNAYDEFDTYGKWYEHGIWVTPIPEGSYYTTDDGTMMELLDGWYISQSGAVYSEGGYGDLIVTGVAGVKLPSGGVVRYDESDIEYRYIEE